MRWRRFFSSASDGSDFEALRDEEGFSQDAAEALNAALGDEVATKADVKFLQWQIGINTALLIAILVKLFVH